MRLLQLQQMHLLTRTTESNAMPYICRYRYNCLLLIFIAAPYRNKNVSESGMQIIHLSSYLLFFSTNEQSYLALAF